MIFWTLMMMMMMMSHRCLMKHMKIFRAWLRPFADSEMEGRVFLFWRFGRPPVIHYSTHRYMLSLMHAAVCPYAVSMLLNVLCCSILILQRWYYYLRIYLNGMLVRYGMCCLQLQISSKSSLKVQPEAMIGSVRTPEVNAWLCQVAT